MNHIRVEAHDELLSPQRCARCSHPFAPTPDKWVFCPRCHACHVGRGLDHTLRGADLARAWLRSFAGDDTIQVGGGWATYQLDGRLFIVRGAETTRTPDGYSVLFERGESDMVSGPRYLIARLAGFATDARPFPSSSVGFATLRPWGIQLVATDGQAQALAQQGNAAIAMELARLAKTAGIEPIWESVPAQVDELPRDVTSVLPRGEQSVSCDRCGAPIAPADVGSPSAPTCPFCLARVVVPPAVTAELEDYRRQMRALDASHTIDGAQLWSRFESWRGGSAVALACAVCGAPAQHEPGAVDERCAHCGAWIIPGAQQLRHAVGEAREEALAAEQHRQAMLRQSYAKSMKAGRAVMRLNMAFWVLGAVMGLCTPIGFLVVAVTSGGDWQGALISVAMMSLGFAIPAGVVAFFFLQRKRLRAVWSPVWSRLAEQLSAVPDPNPNEWLARYWTTAVRPTAGLLGSGPAFGAVAGWLGGVPYLVRGEVDHGMRLWPSVSPIELRIYIAVEWSEATSLLKATRGVRARREQLSAAGFGTCVRRRGFEVSADSETLGRLRRSPDQTALVVPVLFEALRITRLIGGRPIAMGPGGQT